jgi:protein O-GlcNAc transferase
MVEKYPGVADFHLRLADLLARRGEDDEAVEHYLAAIEARPGYLEATVKLGTQHLRRERLTEAAQTFNVAVELNDRLMTAFAGLAVAQHAVGRRHEASATFDLAVSLEPNSGLLFSETTRLQMKSVARRTRSVLDEVNAAPRPFAGDAWLPEALRRHQQLLAQRPGQADLHYRLGLLLRQAGRLPEATAAFRAAVEIHPGYLRALVKLAICECEGGAGDAALERFRSAVTIREDQIDVHYELALLFAQRNQFDLIVEQVEHAGDGVHDLVRRQNLALALQTIGMVDRASATWRSLCELTTETGLAGGR